ncbi:MAG: PAS domain-containing protein, partial [Flavobacterium sp.]|nr:PAS domain-containing protein [Flavobacterium sp.]
QSFKANTTNFIKSVHPDDKYLVENIINKIITDEDLPTIYYRVLTKNNEIRHFKSNGTLITDRFKNKIIVGNTRDISDEKIAKLDIEVRNMELEQSNNELISFNYVASHDLQEPLRKIQTFISRFSEIDIKNLSQNGKGYFLKIEASIVKMRELIDDLLLYSRTSKSEKKFELFDLNETLERTKQELSQIIKDSRATILSNTMPTLMIIPFQMQQLFVNIIINSIKYAKKDVPAIIKIECTKIHAIDYPILTKPVSEEYYEISFADNGIGFDEQYADKVFILFNRLISDDDYQGSGIGLTICKKIAENHLGHLAAHSSINDGSTFTLYLPVLK